MLRAPFFSAGSRLTLTALSRTSPRRVVRNAGESLYVDLVFVLTGILPLFLLPSLLFVMKPIARVVRD